ncbi:hypothetical protein [Kibdelosporangium philippinense]
MQSVVGGGGTLPGDPGAALGVLVHSVADGGAGMPAWSDVCW